MTSIQRKVGNFAHALFCFLLLAWACSAEKLDEAGQNPLSIPQDSVELIVLGIAQDAGYPQTGCTKECCAEAWENRSLRRMVSCLGLADHVNNKGWLFDATPDFKDQVRLLEQEAPLSGIFLTHAHIGHYTGLIHLGREVMGTTEVPVYAMPRMQTFLENNGPWSQLVDLENIMIQPIADRGTVLLNNNLKVRPLLVPHRDEFSETAGYMIAGPNKMALFIPDIDKWSKWEIDIKQMIKAVDYAFLDATFYQNGELPGRDMSEIPHPFVEESMALFKDLSEADKDKVYFIHFNHTNPLLRAGSPERAAVRAAGFHVARQGLRVGM